MKVLVLGGDGMLGHQLVLKLAKSHNVKCTLRRDLSFYERFGMFDNENSLTGLDALNPNAVAGAIASYRPDVVINAIGIVKQRPSSSDILQSLEINASFPHRLAEACQDVGARLLHISTDCVFAGDRGFYSESDVADARDIYGRTKFLGEVSGPNCLTLRTSMIGLELHRKLNLIEWYLAQTGKINGFARAIFSGLTTLELVRVIEMLIVHHRELHGVYQVVAEPISKFDLLSSLNALLGRTDLNIERDQDFVCDRSLDGNRFNAVTGYRAPHWDVMLNELATDIRNR